jgi:hypothetical protein
MSLHLHIDRLVLEGTALTPKDGARLQAALRAELAGLLQAHPLQSELAKGIALPLLPATAMPLPASPDPAAMGRQIAQHLASSLTTQARP